jgi:hypothetical protein
MIAPTAIRTTFKELQPTPHVRSVMPPRNPPESTVPIWATTRIGHRQAFGEGALRAIV